MKHIFLLIILPIIPLVLFSMSILHQEIESHEKRDSFYKTFQRKYEMKKKLEADPFTPLEGPIEI